MISDSKRQLELQIYSAGVSRSILGIDGLHSFLGGVSAVFPSTCCLSTGNVSDLVHAYTGPDLRAKDNSDPHYTCYEWSEHV